LRHDASEDPMNVLRQDDERAHRRVVACALDHRGRRFVTGRLDAEHAHQRSLMSDRQSCGGPPVSSTFTCDGRARTPGPSAAVSMSTRCGSESGKAIVVRTVGTDGIWVTRCRGPVICTLSGSSRMPTGPAPAGSTTWIAERTATLRVQVDSKRSVRLCGDTSRTTASTPSGSATSLGRRSTTSVSGASAAICRLIASGVVPSLRSSRGGPATSASTCDGGSRSTKVLSSVGMNRTGTSSTSGSLALTTNQSTTARKSAVALSARCSVNAATTRWRSELGGRDAGGGACVMPAAPRSAVAVVGDRVRRFQAEELRDERAVALRAPIRGADPLLADRSFAADHERLGVARRLVRVVDGVRRVVQDLECHTVVLRERADRVLAHALVGADGDELESLGAVILVQPLEARQFLAAGNAVGRPDVEDDDLSLVVSEGLEAR